MQRSLLQFYLVAASSEISTLYAFIYAAPRGPLKLPTPLSTRSYLQKALFLRSYLYIIQ